MSARPFEQTVWTVPCHAGEGFFLYTNGADPEFLVEDVPAAYAQLCADALNHMVDRTRAGLAPETGHTVTYGPCQFTLEQMQGGALNYARTCRVGALSRGDVIRLHLDIERHEPLHIDTRPLTTGAFPASTPEECPVCNETGDGAVWRNPQQSQIPTRCNHSLCASCWQEVAMHDQRCPLCRTDVSGWIRRHLFECEHEAGQADWVVDCIVSRVSRSLRESFSSAGAEEARRAAVVQMFQEALQAIEAAIPHDA